MGTQNSSTADTKDESAFVSSAHAENPQLQVLVSEMTTKATGLMIFFSLWIGLGGAMLNFDIGYSGTVLRMVPFNRAFGHCAMVPNPATGHRQVQVCELSATQQSMASSIHLLFMALGAAISGLTSNYLGRKGAIQIGCLLLSIGAAGMMGTSGNLTAYVACKCIGTIGIGHVQAMAPTFAVECTPASMRGFLVALFPVGGGIGYLVVALVCLGSSDFQTNWSWWTPIIIQIPFAVIYAAVIQYFPESPRWLMAKGREAQARKAFARFYNLDPQSHGINAQLQEINRALEAEKAIAATTSWLEIFHRSNIRRTLTSVAILQCAALSGAFAIFTYAAIFLSGVGIKNPYVINVVINACVLAGQLSGPVNIEYLGRRRTLLAGYAGMACSMLIFATVSSGLGTTDSTARIVMIVFLCLWSFIFGGTVAATMYGYSNEMHSVRLRTYAQAFAIATNSIMTFSVNFWTPYMINPDYGNMGTNIGYFYFAMEAVAFVVVFLIAPETARLTLEQLDDFFVSGQKAWDTSLRKNKDIAAQTTTSSDHSD